MEKEHFIYDYYLNIVKPTVDEFLKDKSNLRRGRLAAIVVDHVRDYRAVQLGITPNKVLESMESECRDAVFIRDVCNASKHAILNQPAKIPRTFTHTKQVMAEKNEGAFAAVFGEAMFGESNYVFIKFDEDQELNGKLISTRSLHESINQVINYWDKLLNINS
ncbi:hypothetical protein [Acinetobacter sp.]|uniref:hypothetical protein n=1 Tax=Acinetobacter sp. TaxID=472 RepID=UPI0012CCEA4F|nr:hypothetical protein [Acinetobacter sp.]MPS62149.1 hypothetical protein [Acinetobacter sp.]